MSALFKWCDSGHRGHSGHLVRRVQLAAWPLGRPFARAVCGRKVYVCNQYPDDSQPGSRCSKCVAFVRKMEGGTRA